MKTTITFRDDCPMHQRALDFLRKYKEYSNYDYSSAIIQFILLAESGESNPEIDLFREAYKKEISLSPADSSKEYEQRRLDGKETGLEEMVNTMDNVSEELLNMMKS